MDLCHGFCAAFHLDPLSRYTPPLLWYLRLARYFHHTTVADFRPHTPPSAVCARGLLHRYTLHPDLEPNRKPVTHVPHTPTMSGEAWLYLLAVLINAVNLFLQVFFTIMYSDLEW